MQSAERSFRKQRRAIYAWRFTRRSDRRLLRADSVSSADRTDDVPPASDPDQGHKTV